MKTQKTNAKTGVRKASRSKEKRPASKMLSVRVPRDVHRKIEKMAQECGVGISDLVGFFLGLRCKQPAGPLDGKARRVGRGER